MTLGANTISPLEIEDARRAAYRASELQRGVEDRIRTASADLADRERAYRMLLAQRILAIHAEGKAITVCSDIARGEQQVADLRYERDVARGVLDAAQQEAYRRGADRADVRLLIDWSMRRDLRVDAAPPEGGWESAIGGRK